MKSHRSSKERDDRNRPAIWEGHFRWRLFLAIVSTLSLFACSHPLFRREPPAKDTLPAPECSKNYSREVNLFSGTLYTTWVKYDNLDFNKAFDAALFGLQNRGYSIVLTDRGSGTIHGEMIAQSGPRISHPVDVAISREQTSLIVRLGLRTASQAVDPDRLCDFYRDFEKLARGILPAPSQAPPVKVATPPSVKVQEAEKPVTPPVESRPKPPPSPPLPSPSAIARVTEVAWPSVNLREGPGMNYRITGSAKKGTSLRVLEEKGDWLRVRLADEKEVWVSKSATLEAPQAPSTPSANRSSKPSPSVSSTPSSPPAKPGPSKPLSPM